MTAAIIHNAHTIERHVAHLIPVVFKRSRLKDSFHAVGEVLDSSAVHGRGFVVRRSKGQDPVAVMAYLKSVIEERNYG